MLWVHVLNRQTKTTLPPPDHKHCELASHVGTELFSLLTCHSRGAGGRVRVEGGGGRGGAASAECQNQQV